jgi:hypothetical protein
MKPSQADAPIEFPVAPENSDYDTDKKRDLPSPSLLGLAETQDTHLPSTRVVRGNGILAARLYTAATQLGRKTLVFVMLVAVAIAVLSSKYRLGELFSDRIWTSRSMMRLTHMRAAANNSAEFHPRPERPRLQREEIVQLYRESESGNPAAEYALAARLLAGDGLNPDARAATGWFQKAAESGNRDAQFQLGLSYMLGRGCDRDDVVAYTWLTLSSINGHAEAESVVRKLTPELSRGQIGQVRYTLAEMYEKGIGVPMDKITAYVWYALSEAAGQEKSTSAKEELASEMTKTQVIEATVRASRWLKEHQM